MTQKARQVVPIFFTYDDGGAYVQTGRKSVKARNVSRNGNASVAVYSGDEAVVIRGKASVVKDPTEFRKSPKNVSQSISFFLTSRAETRWEYQYSITPYVAL